MSGKPEVIKPSHIAAAKLKVAIADRKGEEVPAWVRELASHRLSDPRASDSEQGENSSVSAAPLGTVVDMATFKRLAAVREIIRQEDKIIRQEEERATTPVGFVSPELIARARPFADVIWRRLIQLVGEHVLDPAEADQIPDPGGQKMFPGSLEDQMTWDSAAGRSALEKTWLIAALRAHEAAHERDMGVGLRRA